MSWQQIRIPCCGPIDEDTARPFVALGAAVPTAHGVHWRRGAIRPWRDSLASVADVDPASRRFGELLVHYAASDSTELHTVGDKRRSTGVPGCVARITDAYKVLRGVAEEADYGFYDCCETTNWLVGAYWGESTLTLVARHKSSGHVIERRDIALAASKAVWRWPRVLRDPTDDDRIVVVYAQTDVAAVFPALSQAVWHYERYSLSVATGFYAGDTYTQNILAISSLTGGPEYVFHDARELGYPYAFTASFIDDPDPATARRVRTVVATNNFVLDHTTSSHATYPAAAMGAFQSDSDVYIAIARGLSSGNEVVRWRYNAGSYTALASLPVPNTWAVSSTYTAIGGHASGGWRLVNGTGWIAGCDNAASPTLTHTAYWQDNSWDDFAVPFYARGAWHYVLRIDGHCVVVAEHGSGLHSGGGELSVTNVWRLVPIARYATWIASTDGLRCVYPRLLVGSTTRYLVHCRTQVSTDADVDAYVLDFDAAATDWEHDTIRASGVESACTGLLVVPDAVVCESGFVAGPQVTYAGGGANSWTVALQWERVGRDGEIHRSLPTAATIYSVSTTSYSFQVGGVLTRDSGPIRLVVWEADSYGVYRERTYVYVGQYDSVTSVTVNASGALKGAVAQWYGQLSHGPAPSPWHACTHGARTWVISAEDRSSLWPSLLMSDPLVAPVFPASLVLVAHEDRLHRVYSTDVGVVVLGEHGVYVVRGDGPDNTGAGGAHELHRIPGAPGCVGIACQSRWGIVYATKDGVVLLDRGLSVQRISDSIRESITGASVYSATWWSARDLVVLVADSVVWLWNPERGWTTVAVTGAVAARVDADNRLEVIIGNDYAYTFDFLDDDADETEAVRFSTAWIDTAVRPWARIRKVRLRARTLSGTFTATNTITVSVYANGNDTTAVQTTTFAVSDMDTSGEARYYTLRLSSQKFETIRIAVSTLDKIPLEWEWVEFEFLAKRGTAKIGARA